MPFPIVLGGDEITTKLQKDIESLDFGQASPQQAMSQAQSDLSQILGQYYNG
jgi:multiple sugar transport system substrate-binding protein